MKDKEQQKVRKDIDDLAWLDTFAKRLKSQKFFGKLSLTYRAGRIVTYKKAQTGLPE